MPATDLQFYHDDSHDALAEISDLPVRPQAKALAFLKVLRNTDRINVRLEKTHQEELWQKKFRLSEGGLRLMFAFGLDSKVWCLGAFVKRNEKEGNKLLRNRYESLAVIASQW